MSNWNLIHFREMYLIIINLIYMILYKFINFGMTPYLNLRNKTDTLLSLGLKRYHVSSNSRVIFFNTHPCSNSIWLISFPKLPYSYNFSNVIYANYFISMLPIMIWPIRLSKLIVAGSSDYHDIIYLITQVTARNGRFDIGNCSCQSCLQSAQLKLYCAICVYYTCV